MAVGKSWTISVPITKDGGTYGYIKVTFQEDYDALNNYSLINVTKMTGSNTIRSGNFGCVGSIVVNGTTWYSWNSGDWLFTGLAGDAEFRTYSGATYPSGLRIDHNADGGKTITVSVTISSYSGGSPTWTGSGGTVSNSVALTAIPRASDVTTSGGVIGSPLSISVVRASSAFTHTLTYTFGAASDTIISNSSESAIVWTPPMELCSQIPDAASGDCVITCDTYNGTTLVGTKTADVSLAVPTSVGLIVSDGWATIEPYNDGTPAEAIAAYVQGYSRAAAIFDQTKISTENAYGATIASFRITCAGKHYSDPYRTDVLSEAGAVTVTATVIDTRGCAVNEDFIVTVESYVKPIIANVDIFRCNSLGVETDTGQYLSVTAAASISSIAGLNEPSMQLTIGNLMTVEIPDNETVVVGDDLVLSTNTYLITLMLTDKLGHSIAYTQKIPTAEAFFHGRQGGKGAAFGKYSEKDDLLDVAWNLKTKKDLAVEGNAIIDGSLIVGGKNVGAGVNPLDLMPVGFIYISSNPTSPAELFGGTWEQLIDRVIVGAGGSYAVDSTGGEAEHTLTVAEMPNHSHRAAITHTDGEYTNEGIRVTLGAATNGYRFRQYTNAIGGGQAHNNMPPYIAKYIWERVE